MHNLSILSVFPVGKFVVKESVDITAFTSRVFSK